MIRSIFSNEHCRSIFAIATFLILMLLPVFYMILEDLRNNVRWLFGGPWQRPAGTDGID